MMIRKFKEDDFGAIVTLLGTCNVEPPREVSEVDVCFVAEDKGKIIGVIAALVGKSSKAYVDWLAVHEDYRGKLVLARLIGVLEQSLRTAGIKRYTFQVEESSIEALKLLAKYDHGIRILRPLHNFSKELL